MQVKLLFLSFFCAVLFTVQAQQSAAELLDKSIAFHDPTNNWSTFKGQLDFIVERPDAPNGERRVLINNKKEKFHFEAQYETGKLEYEVIKGNAISRWNGSEDIPEEIAKKYRVTEDRPTMYRNYYTYLYGMPMKLKDPGIHIFPVIKVVNFYGKTYFKMKVTYDPDVGKDTWYFYFNTTTFALEAYQFFKDESKNDGEYILFEDLKIMDKIKMPKNRKWFYNEDNKYLATDILK